MSVSLLSRCYGGLAVDVCFSGTDDNPKLFVMVVDGEDEPRTANIPSDKVMDAFYHPFCYLPWVAPKLRLPDDDENENGLFLPDDNESGDKEEVV